MTLTLFLTTWFLSGLVITILDRIISKETKTISMYLILTVLGYITVMLYLIQFYHDIKDKEL